MAPYTDRRQRGFTLLEMMLVIVLIGLTGSLVIGRLSADRDPFARPATALMATLQNALEQATQQQTLYGLALAHNGWQLMAYRREQWHQVQHAPFTLSEQMDISLRIEQQFIPLPARLAAQAEPQLWIYPGGETTVFTLSLQQGNCAQRTSASGFMAFQREEVSCDEG
ncbi:type II secretion system minor pseudopilin GspH [Serratia sp. L9]|uniref:type II secretion system minor pseudopilin GspH n=1 Tax=Serratia sp. L9 TaxID=3423946 RepID=UPI003D66E34D